MRRAAAPLLPMLCLVLLASCSVPLPSSGSEAQAPGSAALSVLLPRGVSASRVTVTASAPGITSLYLQLTLSNGFWNGLLEHVPAGANRSFLAQAYDASDTLIYEGTTSGISIPSRQITLVLVTVHAVDPPPPPPVSEAPRIVSSAQNGNRAIPGRPITFQVVAEDPRGGALTFAWEASVGTLAPPLSDATSSLVVWTSPACSAQSPVLTVTVRNDLGLTTLQHFSVTGPPTCHWSTTGDMITPRNFHTATLLRSGRVLATGGGGPEGESLASELYDPTSGTWSTTGALIVPRTYGHTATLLLDGRVLVVGGHDTTGASLSESEVYDPASGTWSATGSSVVRREGHTATLLPDGRVLVVGGALLGGLLETAEVYDPASGTWSLTGPLAFYRTQHTATLLLDGTVLVAGGFVSTGAGDVDAPRVTAEVYDPASGTWSITGNPSTSRQYTAAARLSDGRVLLAGGGADDPTSAEVYNPATRTWSAVRPMTTGRSGHTATLLPDGQVLVVGGNFTDRVDLYDPTSGTWSLTSPLALLFDSQQATRLLDGRVLFSGLFRSREGLLTTAVLYTP